MKFQCSSVVNLPSLLFLLFRPALSWLRSLKATTTKRRSRSISHSKEEECIGKTTKAARARIPWRRRGGGGGGCVEENLRKKSGGGAGVLPLPPLLSLFSLSLSLSDFSAPDTEKTFWSGDLLYISMRVSRFSGEQRYVKYAAKEPFFHNFESLILKVNEAWNHLEFYH